MPDFGNSWGYGPAMNYGAGISPDDYFSGAGSNVNTGFDMSGATGSMGSNSFGLGANIPTIGLGLQGLSTIGGLYAGLAQLGLAQKSFNLQKQYSNANYTNSAKSYNTALSDRINSRAVVNGLTSDQVSDYLKNNQVSTTM